MIFKNRLLLVLPEEVKQMETKHTNTRFHRPNRIVISFACYHTVTPRQVKRLIYRIWRNVLVGWRATNFTARFTTSNCIREPNMEVPALSLSLSLFLVSSLFLSNESVGRWVLILTPMPISAIYPSSMGL